MEDVNIIYNNTAGVAFTWENTSLNPLYAIEHLLHL